MYFGRRGNEVRRKPVSVLDDWGFGPDLVGGTNWVRNKNRMNVGVLVDH